MVWGCISAYVTHLEKHQLWHIKVLEQHILPFKQHVFREELAFFSKTMLSHIQNLQQHGVLVKESRCCLQLWPFWKHGFMRFANHFNPFLFTYFRVSQFLSNCGFTISDSHQHNYPFKYHCMSKKHKWNICAISSGTIRWECHLFCIKQVFGQTQNMR